MELRAAAAASCSECGSVEHANTTSAQRTARQRATLSNAIAAHRVAGMLELGTNFIRWWLRGVRLGMGAESPAAKRWMYYAKLSEKSAVDVALGAL